MYTNVPEELALPQMQPFKQMENLQLWLTDAKARDQFVVRARQDTEVSWNDARLLKPESVHKHPFWTESYVQWSPLGTYLGTIHPQGCAIWGGASSFERLRRFVHQQVQLIDFSPGEKFIVTYSSHEPSNSLDTHTVVLNIFDTRTGKVKRCFQGSADEFAVGGAGDLTGISWPFFKWAGGRDGKYFARIGKNGVSVYETETFTLIDKKSIKVENVMDFSWSPTDPVLALFVPELGNQPAKVSLYQIPSKVEIRQKNLFSVSNCKMYWQSNGDYLAVKVDRYTKTKKSTYTGFELFRIKERDIPIEVLELENKSDKIIDFAWEPKGHRFAVIHGDNPRHDISFYSMKTTHHTSRVSKLTTLKAKQANALYWSPCGRYIILAGLKGFNGQLEFFNVDELETMGMAEHFMCTDIEWDPSGRYVATVVTAVHEMENGFNIWSFHGKLLYRIMKDNLSQFQWRPRPPSLLSSEKEEEIAKNLKKYAKKYEVEDQDVSFWLSEQDSEKRRLLNKEWEALLKKWNSDHDNERLKREELTGCEFSDDDEESEAEVVISEEVINVKEEIITHA
ncbi:eukaryotic translation initiation factor 3 subunit B-like isoform X2 [Silene latifolia]